MTLPPGTSAPPARRPVVDVSIDWAQLPRVTAALGVALVSAGVVLSAFYSRENDDLDASNFTMGVLATLGLLGIAVAAQAFVPGAERRSSLASWSGAAGAVGAGVMLGVLIDSDHASSYVASAVIIGLSVAGHVVVGGGGAFVVSTILGATLLYGQAFDDLIDTGGHGDNTFMVIGAGVLVFVVLVTAVGWLLPDTRTLSALVVGVGGLIVLTGLLVALFFTRSAVAFSSFDSEDLDAGFRHDPFKNDVSMILLYCALLAVLWLACSMVTGHVGFRALVVAMAVVIVPISSLAVFAKHPTWWEVVTCALGGGVLLASFFLSGHVSRRGHGVPTP